MKISELVVRDGAHGVDCLHPRCQVEDLATPFLRGEAEFRGEGRDCLEPVRRRVNASRLVRSRIGAADGKHFPRRRFSKREIGLAFAGWLSCRVIASVSPTIADRIRFAPAAVFAGEPSGRGISERSSLSAIAEQRARLHSQTRDGLRRTLADAPPLGRAQIRARATLNFMEALDGPCRGEV